MKCVVISQPMYFPWVGLLEQFRLCDTFVYYDDVQFSRGFFNRVQIKTAHGARWLTVPLLDWHRGQLINDVRIDNRQDWKRTHRDQLRQAYSAAPFCNEMLNLVDEVFAREYDIIGDLAQASTQALVSYYSSIAKNTRVLKSSEMNVQGSSTQRLVDLCKVLDARIYLTGHGARHYMEHEIFEAQGIDVVYIDYGLSEYPQSHGLFTPYVSALDLIAHCGPNGVDYIRGQMLAWRTFIERTSEPNRKS